MTATPEFTRRLAHLYDPALQTDVFGRRPASPKEIQKAIGGTPFEEVVFERHDSENATTPDWRELKKQRVLRQRAAKAARNKIRRR